MTLLAGDGHLGLTSNNSSLLKKAKSTDRAPHWESSCCTDPQTWKFGNVGMLWPLQGPPPWLFVVWVLWCGFLYLSMWIGLKEGKAGKGAFTEQPGVCKSDFQRNLLNFCILEKCCSNLKTQWSMSNNTLKLSLWARDLSGAIQMSKQLLLNWMKLKSY